jgi:hypothetical protein
MDAELLELQRQLEAAQSARSSVRLSERNVVELVQKLQERGLIDFELLHTVSGKEYITSVSHPAPPPPRTSTSTPQSPRSLSGTRFTSLRRRGCSTLCCNWESALRIMDPTLNEIIGSTISALLYSSLEI